MLTTVVEIQSKNAMNLSVQTSVSILVSLRSARSAAKEAHITSQNATQCAIPLPCLAPCFQYAQIHPLVLQRMDTMYECECGFRYKKDKQTKISIPFVYQLIKGKTNDELKENILTIFVNPFCKRHLRSS